MPRHNNRKPMHWARKSVYLILISGLLVLGLIGLVLPIIPGLLFLFLAALLLTRISSRFNSVAGGHAGFRRLRRRWQAFNLLKATDRLQLGFWYCAGATLRGIETAINFVQNKLRSHPSQR